MAVEKWSLRAVGDMKVGRATGRPYDVPQEGQAIANTHR